MWCLDLWSPYIPSCVYYSGVLLSRQQGDSLCVYTLWVFVSQKEQKQQCSLVSFACWLVSQSSIFNRESVIIVTWHTFSFRGNSIGFMINLTVRKETARRKFALRCIFSEHCSLLSVTVSGGTIRASWWASRRNEGMRSCFRSADTERPALCILMISQHINKLSV